jgi:glycosyltransferase involved in cell wall biosynthesis
MNRDAGAATTVDEQPLVSLIVRTHGGRLRFLQEALESIRRQDYPRLEVVVVEDGGDTARTTVERAVNPGTQSLIYQSIAKAGRCVAGNVGLSLARGELLGFLDDDDWLLPNHVGLLVRALRDRVDAVASYGLAWEIPTTVVKGENRFYQESARYLVSRPSFSRDALAGRNLFPIQAVLFRRRAYAAHGGFDPRLDQLEDWDLWRRFAESGEFVAVRQITSAYRVPGTMHEALRRQRMLHSYRATFDQIREQDRRSERSLLKRGLRASTNAARRIAVLPPVFAMRWYCRSLYAGWRATATSNVAS